MEQVRTGSPRLWLEVTWVGLFALLGLGTPLLVRHHFICPLSPTTGNAAATTTLIPVAPCDMALAKSMSCEFPWLVRR